MAKIKKFKEHKDPKEKISNQFIKVWRPLFDAYPELNTIPVYAWGRRFKYEQSGKAFEIYVDEDGFSRFKSMLNINEFGRNLQWGLINEIDKEHNIEGGKLWIGTWGDYSPHREDVVKAFDFDDRGGRCLVVCKNGDSFEIKAVACDSPE